MNPDLPQMLAARLAGPLPGPMVGTRFEPYPPHGRHYDRIPADARQSAVLALIYPHQQQWYVPLTERPAGLPDHPGQICLPGGAMEPGESSAEAAVREFCEELGGRDVPIELAGRLSPIYVAASNFRVDPWIGFAPRRPAWSPNVEEVECILEVPLSYLVDPAHFGSHSRQLQGQTYTAPHFAWHSHRIWGATCMILGELVTIVEGLL